MDEKILKRFWSKVNKDGPVPAHCPELGPCWVWTAGKRRAYGRFTVGTETVSSHRISWTMAHGEPPGENLVCHACDNPACVRPSHLFLGTDATNIADRNKKGRTSCGASRWNAKLTPENVVEIRRRCSSGEKQRDVARSFGVGHAIVGKIMIGAKWKHV